MSSKPTRIEAMGTQEATGLNRGKVLIADDELSNRVVLKALLKKLGFQVIQAQDGAQAVELFEAERPSLVMMDVMMPVMDGYEATRRIKQMAGEHFVPVIFLTAMTDEAALSRCIEVGGDDFLTKPYSNTLLIAKVQAMERISGLQRDMSRLYSRMQRDEEIAEEVFSGAVTRDNVALEQIHSLLRPASVFSGDLLLTAFSPSRDLHVLLGDFTGHGLSAALGALPTSEVFRSMTAKGFAPEQILAAINDKLHELLPTGMFLAAQFVRLSRGLDHMQVFNCGMPDCYLVDGASREIKQTIESRSLPLGIAGGLGFKQEAQHIPVQIGDLILLASDGVNEARNPQGEYFGAQRLRQSIHASQGSDCILSKLSDVLDGFCLNAPQDDDISLAEIHVVPELLPAWSEGELLSAHLQEPVDDELDILDMGSDSIEFHITLRGGQLRQADPVPMLINYLQEMAGLKEHRRPLFTILTELFVNALDHGVLQMDSRLKEGPEGFSRYFERRERLLEELTSGFVRIGVRIHPEPQGGFIVIQVEDSEGFDIDARPLTPGEPPLFSGRGITLVESLCESLRFLTPGNRAEAIYRWTTA